MNDKTIPLGEALKDLIKKDYTPGDILKLCRERLAFSEEYVAEELGYKAAYIKALESGKVKVDEDLADEFAELYGIVASSILRPNEG